MEFIQLERDHNLLILKLARGKANALNAAMLEELITACNDAAADATIRALVLASDRPKFFSSGFDVTEVFAYDRAAMTAFFGRFIDLYENLLRLPKPVIAAVNGHAFAGGAVLALACDERVLAEGEFGFALNEVNLGIVLTPGVIRMAVSAMTNPSARALILAGRTLTPAQALATGLAHELAPSELTLERAVARARELAEKPPQAFAAIKQLFLQTAGHPLIGADRQALEQFIAHWFSPEASTRKQTLTSTIRK